MGRILKEAIIGNVPFWILTIISILLIVAAFLCPPMAIIDTATSRKYSEVVCGVADIHRFKAIEV